jgi:G3E family GTPase
MTIPLALVTGFLGSGKTTFLNHCARRFVGRKVVYLVNEFAGLDVDGQLLAGLGPDVVGVAGGSIFCQCLVGEFILHLGELPQRFGGVTPVEGVVVEASGMADPRVVADLLRDTHLDEVYRLASVVAIADPGSLFKLVATLPNLGAQLRAADVVVMNKCDLFPEPEIATAEGIVRDLRPDVRLVRAVQAEVDLDPFAVVAQHSIHGVLAECADAHYSALTVRLTKAVDLPRLLAAFEGCRAELYRGKGFLPVPGGAVYLDLSLAGVQATPVPDGGRRFGLALLAHGEEHPLTAALVQKIKNGGFDVD